MGSGTNATPIMSGLLRRRYSMPEIIMRKHKLAQQKSYDESPAATAPSRHNHASPSSYSFPSPTVSSRHGVTMSTGSDSNLSRRPERGEMSMRKSTLLRRIWSRELKRYDDTRSGSWSPPMRRSQRRINAEPTESFRCEECRKLDFNNGEEDEELVPKRLRLVSNHRQVSTRTSSTITPSTENRPVSTSETPQVTSSNVTPSRHTLKLGNDAEGQETLRVEIETVDSNANISTSDEVNNNTLTSEEKSPEQKTRETTPSELSEPRDSELDLFISKLLIENLKDLEAEISRDCERNNNNTVPVTEESCENQSSQETDKVIYFPRYSLDSKEEMSSYTSNASEFEFSDLPHGEIIKVTTGSTYQNLEHSQSIVVPRILVKYPRTESLEAQPSSASNVEEEEEVEEEEGNCDGSEESVSLVDSLDEAKPLEQEDQSKARDKSEAFFIPIAETPSEVPPTVPPVAEAMPAKLKEKIDQRQKERDIKREEETKKKQKQIEKIMDPKLEDDNFYEKIPTAVKKDSPVKEKPKKPVKSTNTSVLRSEIGLLESYTIDSKGNMQLRAPQKSEPPKPTRKHRRNAPQTTTTASSTMTASTSTTTSKSSSVQGSLQTNSSTSIKPEKKTTVFQSQSDIITPDIENGPRRVYQKTEIKDGEKCIEILEIVECADSSLDSSPERPTTGGKTYRIDTPTRKSKIPIPISRSGKVDRAIAELLIDALNRPDEVGIEIVKSPKEVTKEKSTRRTTVARRNTPKRTNSSSCKYQQIFEVIPEEKSSVSVDSSNEETSKKPSPKIRSKKPPSEPTKAWIGFFKNESGRLSTAIIDEDGSEAAPATTIVEEKKEKLEVVAPSSPTQCLHMKVCQKCRLPEPETTDACTITDSQLKIEIHTTTKSEETTTTTTASLSDSTPSPKIVHNQQTKRNSKVDVWRVQSPVVTHVEDTICEVDSQSFIVLPEGKCLKASPGMSIVSEAASSKCSACCFCNPDLHKTVKDSEKFCPFCNRKKTPVKREEQTNTESDFYTNHRVYQTLTKSDHTHTRTRSRDSDVVSTKCTKTNEKIKQYIPEDHKKSSTSCSKSPSKNLNRPKNVNSLPKSTNGGGTVTVNKVTQNHVKSNVDAKADNFKPFRLPSPYTMASTNSYDGTTSPTSSSDSTCPTTPNKCPQLPPSRRQNHLLTRHVHNRRRISKSHETENAKPAADVVNNNSNAGNTKTGDQNAGWSVTLAGSYNQDLAPDVEMRLSFPKKYPTESRETNNRQLADNSTFTLAPHPKSFNKSTTTNGNLYADRTIHDDDVMNDNYSRGYHPALPPPGGVVNPKKALTRIVSERTHSQKNFNFPEVNSTHNQMVSKQTAKKAIKHMECSVAVTSATRTISKFARGRRTMSYQTLNTTESSQKITNRDRHARDNSLDLGHISSGRRMSSECQTPSDCQTLSVMGNAIEPEQKPRVPTMSEKDLTRRHNGCFTRNRAFIT